MTDQNSQFFAVLTAVGEAKQANANAIGVPWTFAQMGVGDANNTEPVPERTQTRLINERRRAPLNTIKVDPGNPNIIIAEQVIPPDVGGWWIREIGLYDAAGDLVAVANCAPSFKPLLSQGTGKTQVVRLNIIVTSTANVQLKIDPAVVIATREYVDASILNVLPANKAAGTYTQVRINDRGIVQQGFNPSTLAGFGIIDAFTKTQVGAAIQAAIDGLVNGAGASLDTLKELAAALGNDANFAATMTTALAGKAAKATTVAGYGITDAVKTTDGGLYKTTAPWLANFKAVIPTGPYLAYGLASTAPMTPSLDAPPDSTGILGVFALGARADVAHFIVTQNGGSTRPLWFGQYNTISDSISWVRLLTKADYDALVVEIGKKAPLDSPALVGTPTVLAIPTLDISYRIASTRFVHEQTNGFISIDVSGAGEYVLTDVQAQPIIYFTGALTGNREIVLPKTFRQYTLRNAASGSFKLSVKLAGATGIEVTAGRVTRVFTDATTVHLCQTDFINPILTGTVSVPDVAAGTSNGQAANTRFVMTALASLVASSPAALDTLSELAAALGNDANFAATMTTALAGKAAKATTLGGYGIADAYTKTQVDSALAAKAPLNSPAFTGAPTTTTAIKGTSTAQVASCAFVAAEAAAKPNAESVSVVGFVGGVTSDPYFGASGGELVRLVPRSQLPLNTCVRGIPGWWLCGDTGLLRQKVTVSIGDAVNIWTGSVTWPVTFPVQADSVKISAMTADGSVGQLVATYSSLTRSGCKLRVEEWGGLVQTGLQLIVEAEGY